MPSNNRRFMSASWPQGTRVCSMRALRTPIVAIAGHRCGQNRALSGVSTESAGADLPGIMRWRASIPPLRTREISQANMTISVAHTDAAASAPCAACCRYGSASPSMRCCLLAGNRAADRPRYDVADHGRAVDRRPSRGARNRRLFLHHARPALDLDAVAGAGDVRQGLRASPAGAGRWCWLPLRSRLTFALLAKFLNRRLSESATLVFVAAALALTVPHLLARPHVLAMPVMVAWVGGLIAAADRRDAPSYFLLPLMALWANLHGGFVFGLMLVAPDRARCGRERGSAASRKSLALRWAVFGRRRAGRKLLHALWLEFDAGLAEDPGPRQRAAADHGMAAGGFRQHRRRSKSACCSAIGLALLRGVKLPPMRIVLLLGLLHMALAQGRAAEMLALLAPLVSGRPAGQADRRRRGFSIERGCADARPAVRRRRRRAGGGNACLCVGAPLRAAHARLAGRSRDCAEEAESARGCSTTMISAAI